MGKAMMGTGEAEGPDRSRVAAEAAIANPLLDEISLHGAKGVLINITGGTDLTLFELDEAANLIREKVDPEANIIVGSTLDPEMQGKIRVSVVATGIESVADAQALDVQRRRLSTPLHAPVAVPEPVAVEPAPAWEAPARPEPVRTVAAAAPTYAPTPVHAAAAPVQDEFDLDEVLDDATPTRHVAAQQRPAFASQRTAPQAPLPPEPAWQPEAEWQDEAAWAPEPQPVPRPVARRPAGPSPEVIDRLRQAVAHQPEPVQAAPRAPVAAPAAEQRPRFAGLGSLINRMTGHAEPAAPTRPQPSLHQSGVYQARAAAPQPAAPAWEEQPAPRAQDERIEIPAFLRRQAN
jgi:cell division protein FtsZ